MSVVPLVCPLATPADDGSYPAGAVQDECSTAVDLRGLASSACPLAAAKLPPMTDMLRKDRS